MKKIILILAFVSAMHSSFAMDAPLAYQSFDFSRDLNPEDEVLWHSNQEYDPVYDIFAIVPKQPKHNSSLQIADEFFHISGFKHTVFAKELEKSGPANKMKSFFSNEPQAVIYDDIDTDFNQNNRHMFDEQAMPPSKRMKIISNFPVDGEPLAFEDNRAVLHYIPEVPKQKSSQVQKEKSITRRAAITKKYSKPLISLPDGAQFLKDSFYGQVYTFKRALKNRRAVPWYCIRCNKKECGSLLQAKSEAALDSVAFKHFCSGKHKTAGDKQIKNR